MDSIEIDSSMSHLHHSSEGAKWFANHHHQISRGGPSTTGKQYHQGECYSPPECPDLRNLLLLFQPMGGSDAAERSTVFHFINTARKLF
jgi:hypothetical protein